MRFLLRLLPVFCCLVLLAGCTYTFKAAEDTEEVNPVPFGTIKPDLDYSSESPDCFTAAKRIEDNLIVGMTLGDVRRLVGKPRFIWPGAWWWTASFSKKGRPVVRYGIVEAKDDVPILSFSSDTSSC